MQTVVPSPSAESTVISPPWFLTIEYEELCRRPAAIYDRLRSLLAGRGHDLPGPYRGPSSFPCRSEIRLDPALEAAVRQAWRGVGAARRRAQEA